MADRAYTYRVEVDTSSLAAAEAAIRQRLGGAMAEIQSQPQAARAADATLADFRKLEAELKKIGTLDLTAPVDKLQAALAELRQEARRLDAELQGAHIRGGSTGDAVYRAKLNDYYTALAQAQGDDAARLARNRGVVGNIGQINAEFANDTRPVDEFSQNAFAQVEEVRRHSREQTRQLLEAEARLYTVQAAEAQGEQALIAQRIALLEGQLGDDDDGRILQAYAEATDEQERLAAAEVEAAKNLAETKRRLREHIETDAATARKAALQSGDLSAAGGGGRLTVSVTQNTATQAGRLADELERAARMEERITASVQAQGQLNRQRMEGELQLVRAKGQQAAATEQMIEGERTAGARARAEAQATTLARNEQEKRQTADARAEATIRVQIARQESNIKTEEAREARIRATEEERRATAAYRAEVSQRQRATMQSQGRGMLGGGGVNLAGAGALARGGLAAVGLYGVREITQATVRFAELGATSQRTALAFDLLSGSAENARAKLSAVQRASQGAISGLDAMRIANKAAALDMADTASELERVTKFATIVSRVLGTDTAGALDQMALAAANLSFRRLDELGVNAAKARDRFNELKGSMDASKAFLQAMLEVGEQTFAGMEDSALGAATGMERLKAQLTDIKNSMAEITSNALSGPAEVTARVLGAEIPLTELQERIDDAIAGLRDYADHPDVAPRYQLLLELSTAIDEAKGKDNELHAQLLRTGAVIASLPGPPAGEFAAEVNIMIDKAHELTSAANTAANAIARMGAPGSLSVGEAGPLQRYSDVPKRNPLAFGGTWATQSYYYGLRGGEELTARRDAAAAAREELAENVTDVKDKFLDAIDKQQNEWKRAAEKTASEWKRAAEEAKNAFTSAARAVPGLFGASEVTEGQMKRGGAGVPQNFADNYLRRLTDEVLNEVDWESVDIGDAARRAGINPGLPAEIILDLFRESWESGRLFADPGNLDLIDLGAVQAEMAAQRQGALGQENLLSLLQGAGLGEAYGVSAAGEFAQGVAGAIPGELAAIDIAGPAGTAIVAQFQSPAALARFGEVGRVTAEGVFKGYQSAIDAAPFASVLVQSITAAVMANLINAFGPQNP